MIGWWAATGLGEGVQGGMSERSGGVSAPPYDALNLRPWQLHGEGGDRPEAIDENLLRLRRHLGARPVFLQQVHGADCVRLTAGHAQVEHAPVAEADASFTTEPGIACTVLVADCLPVLMAAPGGRAVAAAHAGWRGLAAGVIERAARDCAAAAGCAPDELRAWLGACIGPEAFEVGDEVREAMRAGPDGRSAEVEAAFRPTRRADGSAAWTADLVALARHRLCAVLGLPKQAVGGGGACTFADPHRWFSYRRDRITGRMAASVWLDPAD